VISLVFYITVTSLKLSQYLLRIEETLMLCTNNITLTLGLILSIYTIISHVGFYFPSQFHVLFPMMLTSLYLGGILGEVLSTYLTLEFFPFVFIPLLALVLVCDWILYIFSNIDSESLTFTNINLFKYLNENVTTNQEEKKKIGCFVLLVSSQFTQYLLLEFKRNLLVISLDFLFYTMGGLVSVLPLKSYKFYYLVMFLMYGSTTVFLTFKKLLMFFLLARFLNIFVFSTLLASLFCDITSSRTLNLSDECLSSCKASLFIFLSSFSLLLSTIQLELPDYLLSSSLFQFSQSTCILFITLLLSFPSSSPKSNLNRTETEPAEAANQLSSRFEKPLPDDSSDSIKIHLSEGKNEKKLEIIEKSLQDLEYNCLGIVCGYFPDEIMENTKENFNISRTLHSRKFKSFGETIDELVGQESDNSGVDSKNGSVKRERKSQGSKSSGSSLNASLDEKKTLRASLSNLKDFTKEEPSKAFSMDSKGFTRSASDIYN
jgi:tRNA uridine 5-carbamoylmethylation protein Kti12